MLLQFRSHGIRFAAGLAAILALAPSEARAQAVLTTIPGASFGQLVPFDGQPADLVLDEARKRVYSVSAGAGRVKIYNYELGQEVGRIEVGQFPSTRSIGVNLIVGF